MKTQLSEFLSSFLHRLKIFEIWRRLVVAIPKPIISVGDLKSYQLISMLCFSCKILERVIYARFQPIIDLLLFREQAGFQRGKPTVDKVIPLTENIEDFLPIYLKNGVPQGLVLAPSPFQHLLSIYICLLRFPESLPTQTIYHYCSALEMGRLLRGL